MSSYSDQEVGITNQPIIVVGTVNQGDAGTEAWPVSLETSTTALVSSVTVTTTSTLLLGSNPARKGLLIQCKTSPMYLILGSTASNTLYSCYVLKLNSYEDENYTGPIAAILDSGSADVMVTEKV